MSLRICWRMACVVSLGLVVGARAQITEPITGFESDRDGNPLLMQPGSFGDLEVVIFQDPREADVTSANIVTDAASTNGTGGLRSSEESFVANFTGDGFFGAGGSDQFLGIRFEWANSNGDRWALIETLQSPIQGDPSLHLEGIVSMQINFPACTFEFPTRTYTNRIGVALLIRETGNDFPQGIQDNNPDGDLEFVGVDSVAGANTANPVPVPSTFFNVTDANCSGEASDWVSLTFDLDALEASGDVIGWSFRGGDGVLNATTNGDLVNRGVLAGLVLVPEQTDTTSEYVEFLVDNLEFDAPIADPTHRPRLGSPILQGQTTVRVNDVLSSSTDVQVEIDRAGAPVGFTEIYNVDPAGALFVDVGVPALAVGDQVRANQTNAAGTSDYSLTLTVNPAAVFSLTLSLDEDGNAGLAPADFEFVGASSLTGGAPQGKPAFVQNGVWQKFEFSLIPGVEPVIDFAGGNGLLTPDGGSYNIDALWFTIDPTDPRASGYDIFIDSVYYIDANDTETIIANADPLGILGNPRGQNTAINVLTTVNSGLASFDGTQSNRLRWDFPDNALTNTCSILGPRAIAFPDGAKAMGMRVLVEDVQSQPCDRCGAGPHWIHSPGCPAGTDRISTGALVGLDTNLDCTVDTNLILSGPSSVKHVARSDDSAQFPGTRPVDDHLDVIDTEMLSLTLSGGGVTLTAGQGLGTLPLAATLGAIAEQPGNASLADSFFDVFFEVDLGGGNRLYNQTAMRVESVITCLPPAANYLHPVGICVPLFTSPTPGQGILVANLVSASHETFPQPFPVVSHPIYGDQPAVTVTNISSNGTSVDVLVNGAVGGTLLLPGVPAGVQSANVPIPGTLALGDSIAARYTSPGGMSGIARARGVLAPPAPTLPGPLSAGQTSVTVNTLLTLANATASQVRVYDGNTLIGTAAGGTASVNVTVTPLILARSITASQVVNSLESARTAPVVVAPPGCPPRVVINEFQYEDSGTDDREFVELYNADVVAVDISGWRLRASDTVAPPGDNNADYTIPAATVLAVGDYYVLGPATVPGVDQVVGATDLWENDNEALELLDAIGAAVDQVIVERNKGPLPVSPAEGGLWGNMQSIDATDTKPAQAWARWFDGYDTNNNGRDFGLLPITPGAANFAANLAPFTDNFNTGVVDTDVANWTGSFVNAKYINPEVVSTYNRYAIPASPDGGMAISLFDTTGGGDSGAPLDRGRYNLAFTCEIYIDATTSPFTAASVTNELETWSLGIGTGDSFHNVNSPAAGAVGANGNIGLAWEYFKFEDAGNAGLVGGQFLLLKNENDGGDDGVTLFTVPPSALTTGWHTISLSRNYENWSASFDSISTNGVAAGNGPGHFYAGYREIVAGFPTPGTSIRPPTIDNLALSIPTAPTVGACCADCGCEVVTTAECVSRGGTYAGDGTDCADLDLDGVADDCGNLTPEATITAAAARKVNSSGPGGVCDLPLLPVRKSEPRSGGVTEVRVTFDVAPGGPGAVPVSIEQATCAAPAFAPYTGASVVSGSIAGNDLVLSFAPGLENGRTYRMTIGSDVTSIAGQTIEVRGLLGDVNNSGGVNATDRSTVVGAWTGPGGFTCSTDVNSSGQTNATDRSVVVGAWTGPTNCAP